MEKAVCLIELVVVDLLGTGQRGVGIGPPPDERPLFRRALGREVPQDAGFHGGALVDELIHDLTVQPGHSGTLVRHNLHQPIFLQPLQHHPDHGARCPKAGAERVFTQRAARPQGQVDDLPLQYSVNFSVGLVLFHNITLPKPHRQCFALPPPLVGAALAFRKVLQVTRYAKGSTPRGAVTADD